MLGYLYLVLNFSFGYCFCNIFFPDFDKFCSKTYKGNLLDISGLLLKLPAWFLTGAVFMNWGSYLLACLFANRKTPLLLADEIIMILSIAFFAVFIFIKLKKHPEGVKSNKSALKICEILLFAVLAFLFAYLLHITFFIEHDSIYIGLSVFSDFTPHLSMIRSFSYGQNFPAVYSVCAGEDIKYHFMFEFLVGNLEFLGIRIDHAFNIAALLGILSMYMLLYVFTCKISGKRTAGIISVILVTFRSSAAMLLYLEQMPKGTGILKYLKSNTEFIGFTDKEDWGLWNLNVYLNQRHLPFALGIMLLILMIFTPALYSSFKRIEECNADLASDKKKCFSGLTGFFKYSLFSREGWVPKAGVTYVGAGLLLGALGFYNGAVVIATLLILFFIAIAADSRLEYLITAVIAGMLILLQTNSFIDNNAFSFSFQFGFLAENRTFFGSVAYLIRLLGILPILMFIVFAVSKSVRRYMIFAFSTPLIMAFTCSLTPDITVNHKYIMISVMLLDIFAAVFIVILFGNKNLMIKSVALIVLICLVSTGVYDTFVIVKRNEPKRSIVNSYDSAITQWIHKNCTASDLFLTSNYFLCSNNTATDVIMSGAMMYQAWQYFGWSAGYDTDARQKVVIAAYSAPDSETLRRIVYENGFDYIIIDSNNRTSSDYKLNEAVFDETYPLVYTEGEGEYCFKIYKCDR